VERWREFTVSLEVEALISVPAAVDRGVGYELHDAQSLRSHSLSSGTSSSIVQPHLVLCSALLRTL